MAQTASITSAFINGIDALPVTVTASVEPGMPAFRIFGVREAYAGDLRGMVKLALRASGYDLPRATLNVSVEPSTSHYLISGPQLELPVALAILAATSQVEPTRFENALVVGSLDMSGGVREVRGVVAYMELAKELDKVLVAPPQRDHRFAGIQAHDLRSLSSAPLRPCPLDADRRECFEPNDAKGHPLTKLAMLCSAVGGHTVLLSNSWQSPHAEALTPWSVAHGIRRIMPGLTPSDQDLVDRIASICDTEPPYGRPIRAPHSSITLAAMVGGGRPIHPGEVTLASEGVLFLDDVEDFNYAVLRSLDISRSEGHVVIARSGSLCVMPAETSIVMSTRRPADMLPGAVNDLAEVVVDLSEDMTLDLEVGSLTFEDMVEIVSDAWDFGAKRAGDADLGALSELTATEGLESISRSQLSRYKVYKVARTLADIGRSQRVRSEHIRVAATLCGGRIRRHDQVTDPREPILAATEEDFDLVLGKSLHLLRPIHRSHAR